MIKHEGTREINCLSISVGERFMAPTPEQIKAMAASMAQPQGQVTPIIVTNVTRMTYRLVAGATRLRAAIDILRWKKIRVEVIYGDELDYKVIELTENLDRRDLTAKQRKDMRKRRVELQRELLARVKLAKGGRGNKGGLREAARAAGMPETTARKLRQNIEGRAVYAVPEQALAASVPATSTQPRSVAGEFAKKQVSVKFSILEYGMLSATADARRIAMAELIRQIVHDFLQQPHPPAP